MYLLEVNVQPYHGTETKALVFQAMHYGETDKPSKHYLDIITSGARENGIDENYILSINI